MNEPCALCRLYPNLIKSLYCEQTQLHFASIYHQEHFMNSIFRCLGLGTIGLALVACASSPDIAKNNAPMAKKAPTKAAPAAKKAAPAHKFAVVDFDAVTVALQKGALMIDARGPKSYAKGHIPGAVNGPCNDRVQLQKVLPTDKSRMLIFYCGGPQCSASQKSAAFAFGLGYKQVAEYKAGYPDWAKRQPAPATK
jgi:rhodanese-related sulfurtransferase